MTVIAEHETILLAAAAATLWGAAALTLFRYRRSGHARVLAIAASGMTMAAVNSYQMARLGDRVRDCMLSVADLQQEAPAPMPAGGAADSPADPRRQHLRPVAPA
jgi:hypothetical protein